MSFATPQHFLVCIIDGKSSAIDPSNVRLWHFSDIPTCTDECPLLGVKRT